MLFGRRKSGEKGKPIRNPTWRVVARDARRRALRRGVRRRTAGRHDARAGAQGGGDSEHLSARVRGPRPRCRGTDISGSRRTLLDSPVTRTGESRVVNDESSLSHFAHMMIIAVTGREKDVRVRMHKRRSSSRRKKRVAPQLRSRSVEPGAHSHGGMPSARGDRAPFARVPRGERDRRTPSPRSDRRAARATAPRRSSRRLSFRRTKRARPSGRRHARPRRVGLLARRKRTNATTSRRWRPRTR